MGLAFSRGGQRGGWRSSPVAPSPPSQGVGGGGNQPVATTTPPSPAPVVVPLPDVANGFRGEEVVVFRPPTSPAPTPLPIVAAPPTAAPLAVVPDPVGWGGPTSLSQIRICPEEDPTGPPDGFSMCMDLIIDPRDRDLFVSAAKTWGSKIRGDVEDVDRERIGTGNTCEQYSHSVEFPEVIDDLFFCGIYREVDGPHNILGYARPTQIRPTSGLPISGVMQFDVDDLDWLRNQGMLLPLIMHEMGHVFGIGTLWKHNGVTGPSSEDSEDSEDCPYLGEYGIREWERLSGCKDGSAPPLELDGDSMTRCLHFDEDCFGDEIMTGYLSNGPAVFSSLTIAALKDLGYDTHDFDEVSDGSFEINEQCKCPAGDDEHHHLNSNHDRHLRRRVLEPTARQPTSGGDEPRERQPQYPTESDEPRQRQPQQPASGGGDGTRQRQRQRPRARLSAEGERKAVQYGRKMLNRARVERDERGEASSSSSSSGEDARFVGDQFISVMVAEDGVVHTVDVSMHEHRSNIFQRDNN